MDAEPALGREHLCRAEMIPGRSQGFRITCTEAGLAWEDAAQERALVSS